MGKNFIPLSFDLMFKKVFGNPKCLGPIRYLLKLILNIEPKEINIMNTELIGKPYKDKKVEVDLIVKLKDGTKIGIEVNTLVRQVTINRNMYYLFRNISKDLKPKEKYNDINKHIQINFDMEGYHIKPILDYTLRDSELNTELTDIIRVMRIDVPFYTKKCYNENGNELDCLDKFIALFGATSLEEVKFICKGDKKMEEIGNRIEEYNDELDVIGAYDYEWHQKELARIEKEEAIEKVTKEVTQQSKIDIAKNMLKKGSSAQFISEVTGLTIREVEKISID